MTETWVFRGILRLSAQMAFTVDPGRRYCRTRAHGEWDNADRKKGRRRTMTSNEERGLVGKEATVTGGGAASERIGNGRAACILLARAGAQVLVVDRDRSNAG